MHQPHLRVMIDREAQARKPSLTKLLFGAPGDFFDRHQGLTLAIVGALVLIGGAV